jgi:hypothetical protein
MTKRPRYFVAVAFKIAITAHCGAKYRRNVLCHAGFLCYADNHSFAFSCSFAKSTTFFKKSLILFSPLKLL